MTQTQYYITTPGGKPVGPYTIDELESLSEKGKLTPEHIYCVEGMTEWLPISRIVDLPAGDAAVSATDAPPLPEIPVIPPVPGVPAHAEQALPAEQKPNTHVVGAIVALVCSIIIFSFSIPLSVIAIIQAARADNSWTQGKMAECRRLADSAWLWIKITWGFSILQVVLVIAGAIYFGSVLYSDIRQELEHNPEFQSEFQDDYQF